VSPLQAIRLLTILPAQAPTPAPGSGGRVAAWFPLAGLVLGGCGWALVACLRQTHAFSGATPEGAAVITVMLLAFTTLLTGGFHLDGLADTFDALGSRRGAEGALEIMRDSRTGAYGVMALCLSLALKGVLIWSLSPLWRVWGLTLAMAASRWGQTAGCAAGDYARPSGGLGASFANETRPIHAVGAGALPLGLLLLTPVGVGLPGALGAVLAGPLAGWGFALWCGRRFGGITGDTLGAGNELAEILVLFILAAAA
jgi:adenosylcobinamide-GDP ribazoletransferase